MKKVFLISMSVMLSIVQAIAATWTDANGATWTFSKESFTYSGSTHQYYTITAAVNYGNEVVVPGTVYNGETPITIEAIGREVFKGNNTLSAVFFPSTIKYIGYKAFEGCTALTTIGDILKCEYTGDYTFSGCTSLNHIGNISALTAISIGMFKNTKIENINLPNINYVGYEAFANCTSLNAISFPECTTVDGNNYSNNLSSGAFYGCSTLGSINLPKATFIGFAAFAMCTSLTEITLPEVTTIGTGVFSGCSKIENVTFPKVTSVGYQVFSNCGLLKTVSLPECTTINGDDISITHTPDRGTFYNCLSLNNVYLPKVTALGNDAFYGCTALTSISLPAASTIGGYAFYGCSALKDISLPSVTTISNNAFDICPSLNYPAITSTGLVSIGSNVFTAPGSITLMATTPPTLSSNNAFGSYMVVRVPDESYANYCDADKWSDIKSRILKIGTKTDYDIEVNANDSRSILHEVIGQGNLNNVVSLKVKGGINSYDIMVIRNKMDNLHFLDLTDADIVANNYEYITGYHTENNVMPACGFQNLTKLVSVKLPKSITSIGSSAFYKCTNLVDVEFQTGLETIGSSAFSNCTYLKEVTFKEGLKTIMNNAFFYCQNLRTINLNEGLETIGNYAFGDKSNSAEPQEEELIIPYGVTNIGSYAFGRNKKLKHVILPNSLKTIGEGAFYYCEKLERVNLPTSLQLIPNYAFNGCTSLTVVHIPSTITSIGNNVFVNCPNVSDVFVYVVEPTPITMNTFSTYKTATLHVPATSYYNYWYDTEWSQFKSIQEIWKYELKYFYINKDYTIGEEKGVILGEESGDDPDADLNPGSGLIIETSEDNPQLLDEVHIKAKGSDVASVITASNMVANKVYFDIEITAGRWYFLSFPFNVKTANVEAPGAYTFRYYDPDERANGNVGWQNWIGDLLYAGQGYIFHCAKGGTLSLCVEKEDMDWDAEDRPQELASTPAANQQDASWNFLGNTQTSYVDIDQTGYNQPITVWNGTGYDAVRPGDDTYALSPFEAFFVQKPDNQSEMDFPADGRYTQTRWNAVKAAKAAARRELGASMDRQIVNLTLTDGKNEDKTRVVFNEKTSKGYEMTCDAAKFLSSEKVPQLYTLDQQQTRYAINERPLGEVQLGYVATADGELTIRAMRMDQPVMLRDTKLQITHDLSMGDYTFMTTAGTHDDRFLLVQNGDVTGIGQLRKQTGVSVTAEEGGLYFMGITDQTVNIYSLSGTLLASNVTGGMISLPKAAYIVKVGSITTKVLVR